MNVDNSAELSRRIGELKREKNAVILAHYYTTPEVQAVADFLGDSLALSVRAQSVDADIILFAGVHFMAETAKVLCPEKKVLIPCPEAGCSLAESCDAGEFAAFKAAHPGHTVVSYVNTTVGVKALTDICCTSSNALKVVESIPADQPVIFAPDRNLGSYIQKLTGRRNMVLWDGACHVHEEFSLEKLLTLKREHPAAKVVVHPECPGLYRRSGRLCGFHGGDTRILRPERRAGVHRGDRGGNPRRDEEALSGKRVHPGASRRRDVRMQQLQVYEDGDAGEHLRVPRERIARDRARRRGAPGGGAVHSEYDQCQII